MNKLISIIVPVYKVPEKLLLNCIDSCINQTFREIEIILVDDGSPDKCGTICDHYKEIDNRIVVIHQENKGLSEARNTGVRTAQGKWIMFLDGDDYIDEKMCETLFNYTKEMDLDIVCCAYVRKMNDKFERCFFNGIEEKQYKNQECKFLQEKVLDFNSHFSSANGKLIKREFLIQNNLFHNEELKQGAEGIEFNIRLFEYAKSVFVKKAFLYYYVYNEDSITQKHNEKNHYLVLKCFEKIKELIEKSDNRDNLLKNFYNRICYVLVTIAISGYFNKSNTEKYKVKKEKFSNFLKQSLIIETFEKCDLNQLDFKRKIIILLIKFKMFRMIDLLAKIKG